MMSGSFVSGSACIYMARLWIGSCAGIVYVMAWRPLLGVDLWCIILVVEALALLRARKASSYNVDLRHEYALV